MTTGDEREDFIEAELFELAVGAITQRDSVKRPNYLETTRRSGH